MWQHICGWVIRSVAKLNGRGSASPGCSSHLREVDGSAVEPAGRAGLEAGQLEAAGRQAVAECFGGLIAGPAAAGLGLARVHEGFEKRAGGEDHGPGAIERVAASRRRRNAALLACAGDSSAQSSSNRSFDDFLPQGQVRLRLDALLHVNW